MLFVSRSCLKLESCQISSFTPCLELIACSLYTVQLLACTNNSSICFMNFEKESFESWFEKRQQNRISVKEWQREEMIIYAGKVTNTLMQFCLYSKPPHRLRPQGPTTFQTLPSKPRHVCHSFFLPPSSHVGLLFVNVHTQHDTMQSFNQTEEKEPYP